MKNIFYFGHCWADNIGNAFIDYGINYSVKKVIKHKEYILHNISNMQPYNDHNFNKRFPYSILSGGVKNKVFDLRQATKPDLIILGGSLFDIFWCKVHESFLEWLIKKQYPVFVLGGGGGNKYTKEELNYIKYYWNRINFVAYASRDEKALSNFGGLANERFNGIDNALFLNDAFTPAKLNTNKFVINSFDLTFDRNVTLENLPVIKLAHRLLNVDSFKFFLKKQFRMFKQVKIYDYISDYPDDYLHLYSNAESTYSDRVHACVATLIFGGQAMYFDKSDRSYLFDRIKLSDIRNNLVRIDKEFIEREKEKQLEFIEYVLDSLFTK